MYLKFRLKNAPRYLLRERGINVFHCCIQKTATQWFRSLFQSVSREPSVRYLSISGTNHVPRPWRGEEVLRAIPDGVIVSPLYIRIDDFLKIFGDRRFKAFFVFRDPRDIVVSDYFSLKETHPIKNEYYAEWRHKLADTTAKEGIAMRICNMEWNFTNPLRGWSAADHPDIKLIRYETFFGENHGKEAANLLQFLDLRVGSDRLNKILEHLSFKKKSKGRSEGQENIHSHYRKGKAGDWMNHFDDELKDLFKSKTGDLLQVMGYESNSDW